MPFASIRPQQQGAEMETQHTGGRAEDERPRHETASGQTGGRMAETGRSLAETVKGAASARVADQKHRASEGLDQIARALRKSTDALREDGQSGLAEYVQHASERIERFSHRLDEQDLQAMLDQVQRFAHRQPGLFIGAAFGLGLLGGRLLKSSPPGDHRRTASGPKYQAPGTYPPAQGAPGTGRNLTPASDLHGGGPIS
jgi:hypothetical protein